MIEYGTTTSYGHTTTTLPVVNTTGGQSETVALSGLEACTTYHYQAEAQNEANEDVPSLGGDQTFTTDGCPPTVLTGSAHEILETCGYEGVKLELTGTINPNGLSSTYYFEYTEYEPEGYKSKVIGEYRTPTESAGSGTEPIEVSSEISVKDPPLPCWEIKYRLVGVNATGTSYGESRWSF
jgi:hypothetical protein